MDLNGKVCLVTGGTGGIGGAAALELARRGADVVIHGILAGTPAARQSLERIEQLGRRCVEIAADLALPEASSRSVKQTVEAMGRLDVLVHCAGGAAAGRLMEVRPETWYRAFDIHLHAAFHLCRAAVPHMVRQGGGAIVLISSAAGSRGAAGAIAYGVAKGAVQQFTRSLARELAELNIRVNCVSPGIIRTPFQDYLTPEQVRDNIENRIPLRREGQPEEVAEVIAMLVANDYITGENVAIDGGLTMRIV